MEKKTQKSTTAGGVLGRLLQVQPRATAGSYPRMRPCSSEVNGPYPFLAGKSTERPGIHQKVAQRPGASTSSGPVCAESGKPIDLVTLQHSWQAYMGQPMVQIVPGTCVLLACTVCLQAVDRIEHEKLHHDEGRRRFAFPWTCMDVALRKLFINCVTDDTWVSGRGANIGKVLNKIQQMGELPATTSAPTLTRRVLPLRSWETHWWGDCHGRGLSPERVATLLYNNGPCVGLLWVVGPWYHRVDADRDDELVYTTGGCGRSGDARRRFLERRYPGQVGWHAVVCFGYKFCGDQMHVLVLDNHTPTGPRRWIHIEELHTMCTMTS